MANQSPATVIQVEIASLSAYRGHARKHPRHKLDLLKKSILESDLLVPPIINGSNVILSGHLRVKAFDKLGFLTIPCMRVTHLTPQQEAAFVIAANRMPEVGDWDRTILKQEMQILTDLSCEFDADITGFEMPEIDLILQTEDTFDPDEPQISAPPAQPRTRPGDLIRLGSHFLLNADSREPISWKRVMRDGAAAMCFSDAPYNVKIKGHVTSKDHREFAMASGEMSDSEYTEFLFDVFSKAAEHSRDGALHFLCIDHRHLREMYAACDRIYEEQLNLLVWSKNNAGMGAHYRSRHELIPLFKVGSASHVNNVQLGRFGRNRSNVWSYPGANSFGRSRDEDLAAHPTPKPVAMVADAILDSTHPRDVVLDPFGGAGTMILAAEQTGRRARVIEIDPGYCDVTIRRWEEYTGEKAVLLESGAPLLLPAPPKLLPPPVNVGGGDV